MKHLNILEQYNKHYLYTITFGHLSFETNGNIGIFLPVSQNLEGCSSQVKVSTDASVNFKRNN